MTWTWRERPLRSVLVTRLRFLGDIAMATVVLDVLRRGDPGLRLGFLCEAPFAPLLRDHPWLARRHSLAVAANDPRRSRTAAAAADPPPRGTLAMIRELRRERYDAAVDLFFNPRSAWLLRLAGVPLRLAGPRGWRSRLYTAVHAPPADDAAFTGAVPGGLGAHVARLWPLRHAESGLSLRDWLVAEAARQPFRAGLPPPRRPLPPPAAAAVPAGSAPVVLAPGATWPTKRWAPERWAELACRLVAAGETVAALRPPGGDAALAAAWRAAGDPAPLLPSLSLADALAVTGRARLLIACDGGIMHAGVAMGRPVLALFGPTDPDIWFPYARRGPYRVLAARPDCHPCDRHVCDDFVCMPALAVADVAAAARELLAGVDGA